MKKIVFVTNDSWFFVSHRLPIAKRMAAQGYRVVVVARPDQKTAEIVNAGCSFIEWTLSPRGRNIFAEIRAILNLAFILLREKPSIVHLITIKAVLYGGAVARMLRIKKVVFAISGLGAVLQPEQQGLKSIPIKYLYKFALSNSRSSLIFQNSENCRDLQRFLNTQFQNTWIIPGSGVDLNAYPYTEEPDTKMITIVMACRLLKDKGVCEFVEAAKQLLKTEDNLEFVVAGEDLGAGNPAAFSKQELAELKSSNDVAFIGNVEDIAGLFSQAHVVVLPSYHEGFPKVLIEAAACGRAIVTTDVPGCRDSIIDGETGFLVPPKDAAALAKAISRLANDPAMRRRMSVAARSLAESKYSISDVVDKHVAIYNS